MEKKNVLMYEKDGVNAYSIGAEIILRDSFKDIDIFTVSELLNHITDSSNYDGCEKLKEALRDETDEYSLIPYFEKFHDCLEDFEMEWVIIDLESSLLQELENLKKSSDRLDDLFNYSEKTMSETERIKLFGLENIIKDSFEDWGFEIQKEIDKLKELINVESIPEIEAGKLEKLVHTRWKSIEEIEEYLGIKLVKEGKIDPIVEDYFLASKNVVSTTYQGWGEGFIIIPYLTIPHGEDNIYITEVFMN